MGESTNACATLRFDRRIRLEFRGATITSDAGLLARRELDDALGLTETASECLQRWPKIVQLVDEDDTETRVSISETAGGGGDT